MPQRSILGPALFTIFMNDLANGIKYTTYQHLWFRHSVPKTEADKLEELINTDLAVTRSMYLPIALAKLGLAAALKLSLVGWG